MVDPSATDITKILSELSLGDRAKADLLMPVVYERLRALAASMLKNERKDLSLQPTALVNEAYLRLVDQNRIDWKGRSHFFAIGATMMRRILVDHAKNKRRLKRGGGWERVGLDNAEGQLKIQSTEDVLAVDEALEKLASIDPQQAKIVELRFFGGLTVAEVAEVLQMSKRKVEYEWEMIRAWLRRELGDEDTK